MYFCPTCMQQLDECGEGGGALPNKGSYGCVASAKPRQVKISRKKPNIRANNCQKPNDQASCHYF